MDSVEVDTFVHGSDAVMDIETELSSSTPHGFPPTSNDPFQEPSDSTLPPPVDSLHTSTLPPCDDQSVDTPTLPQSDNALHTSTIPESDNTPHTSDLPQSVNTPRTSNRRQSVNTPHTSAGGRAHSRGRRSSSPPPAKRRLLKSSSPKSSPKKSPRSSSHTSPRRHRTENGEKKWRTVLMDRCGALPPPVIPQNRWHDTKEEDVEPRQFLFCPSRTPGVHLNSHKDYSPSDLFQLFFSKDVMRTLCSNTNKYAARRTLEGKKAQWSNIEVDEMFRFFSIIIYLGLVRPSATRDLWRKDRLHTHPFPSSVITGYRYEAIHSNLHMSDPAEDVVNKQLRGQPGYDALFSIKPLHDQILTACQAYYHPHRNISIDERMVATKARIGMKQYMKNKPIKWGYKLFILADSCSGYTYNFSIYEGKAKNPSGNGLSFDSVVNLVHVPSLGTGYNLYVDNFYTSAQLFLYLHRMRVGACGTIRQSRIGFPKATVNALPKNAERGEMRWIREGSLLFVKWRDTRDVNMCSTIHKAYSGKSVQRRVRTGNGTWSTKAVPIPEPVHDYNKYMGGVDLSDALIKFFTVTQKTRRWYIKLFLHFIDIAVVNSYIIYKEVAQAKKETVITQKVFRERLCLELAEMGKLQMLITPVPTPAEKPKEKSIPKVAESGPKVAESGPKISESGPKVSESGPKVSESGPRGCFPVPVCELSDDPHLKASKGRRKCVHCKMKTIIMCRSCKVPLCIVADRMCFTEWHDLNT